MELVLNIVVCVLTFVVGATVASFLNVVIYRLPRGEGFVKGTSYCPNCSHKLAPPDLIPIVSYLLLGRKCRYCKESISPRYMVIELLGGVLALFSYLAFLPPLAFLIPRGIAGLFSGASSATLGLVASWISLPLPALTGAFVSATIVFLVLCLLVLVAFVDGDTMEIPNSLSIWLAALGIIGIFFGPTSDLDWYSHLIGAICVSVPMLVMAIIIEGAFGLGDVKLMAAAGLFLGWELTLLAAFIGVVVGGLYGIYLLASRSKGRKDQFAFGPALCVGIATAIFFGDAILSWYTGFLV